MHLRVLIIIICASVITVHKRVLTIFGFLSSYSASWNCLQCCIHFGSAKLTNFTLSKTFVFLIWFVLIKKTFYYMCPIRLYLLYICGLFVSPAPIARARDPYHQTPLNRALNIVAVNTLILLHATILITTTKRYIYGRKCRLLKIEFIVFVWLVINTDILYKERIRLFDILSV